MCLWCNPADWGLGRVRRRQANQWRFSHWCSFGRNSLRIDCLQDVDTFWLLRDFCNCKKRI